MKKILTLTLLSIGVILSATSCEDYNKEMVKEAQSVDTSNKTNIGRSVARTISAVESNNYGLEALRTEQSQLNFNHNQPAEIIEWSLEREQLNEKILRWNDPNKISYITLFDNTGGIRGYFTIKGKVSSVNSKLTNTSQLIYFYSGNAASVESPDMDGSYGSNGDAIFFFLTDGTYMEYTGDYLVSDNPVVLNTQPAMTYIVDETPED